MKRVKKSVTLAHQTDNKIQEVMAEKTLTYGKAIDYILEEYNHINAQGNKDVADEVYEKIKKDLTRIRLGSNNADKNSQILIEMLNNVFINSTQFSRFIFGSTERIPHESFTESKKFVADRIHAYKTKREEAKLIE